MRQRIQTSAPQVQAQRHFTKTASGRVYDNGLRLRKGIAVSTSWQRHYFPRGHYHSPYYRTSFLRGSTFYSPFGFYFGVCVPFISASVCNVYPPAVTFIDEPVYSGADCNGFADDGGDNLFNDPNLSSDQPGLMNAIDDINEAYQGGNVDGLVTIVNPNASVAIYQRGSYQYSLAANNYLDMARDAIASMHTVSFTLNVLHQRGPNVFSVSGKQVYQDQNGNDQVEWVSFVLQDISGIWTLTQTGTAPAHYQAPTFY